LIGLTALTKEFGGVVDHSIFVEIPNAFPPLLPDAVCILRFILSADGTGVTLTSITEEPRALHRASG
jgi:hypothetical protein